MNTSPRQEKVDEMRERAEAALRRSQWFEAERIAQKALELARREEDFGTLARIALPLQEARRQRIQQALGNKQLRLLETDISEEMPMTTGCYLVQPPSVGADARRLRLAALRREIAVAVICREPKTRTGLCPVVAIGQFTVRARIRPPANWEKPDHAWFVHAMEALGDSAIDMLDTGMELDRQIDFLLGALDAVPDHEKLHQVLAAKCQEATKGFVRSDVADPLDVELAQIDPEELDAELGEGRRKKVAAEEDED